jgi:hypothetical protein
MSLDDQLRTVLTEEAERRSGTLPDVPGLISGGRSRRRRRHVAWAGATALAAVVATGGVYAVPQLGGDDSVHQIADQPSPQPLPDPAEPARIDPGTYLVHADGVHVVASYTITVPAGWEAKHANIIGKHQEDATGEGHEAGALGIEPFALDTIRLTEDTCTGPERLGRLQTDVAGLVAGLKAQGSGLRVSDPVPASVGGRAATRIDLEYPSSRPLSHCRLSDALGLEKGVLQVWSGYLVLFPTERASVYVVDVAGRKQVFVTRIADDASGADREGLASILDSIRFGNNVE